MADEQTVKVRVISARYPPEKQANPALIFGMQDKAKNVHPGAEQANGEIWFECELRVKHDEKTGTLNFLGDYAHGTPQQRFIYLALGYLEMGHYVGIKRWKIHLSPLTWAQVKQAIDRNATLQAKIEGTRAASVPLLDDGWIVV